MRITGKSGDEKKKAAKEMRERYRIDNLFFQFPNKEWVLNQT